MLRLATLKQHETQSSCSKEATCMGGIRARTYSTKGGLGGEKGQRDVDARARLGLR